MKQGYIKQGQYNSAIGIRFTYFNNKIHIYEYWEGHGDQFNSNHIKKYIYSFNDLIIPDDYINVTQGHDIKDGGTYEGVIYNIDKDYSDIL